MRPRSLLALASYLASTTGAAVPVAAQSAGIARTFEASSGAARPGDLPDRLMVAWRKRLSGPPAGAPAVDARGRIVTATVGGLVTQLAADGGVEWSRNVGSEPGGGPVIGVDGTRYLLTRTATLLGWDPRGHPVVQQSLSTSGSSAVGPRVLGDGTLVVAIGADVLRLERDGRRRSLTRFASDVHDVVADERRIVALLRSGELHEWVDPAPPRHRGTFRGPPTSSPVLSGGIAATIVDNRDLETLDLVSGIRTILLEDTPQVALARRGRALLSASPEGTVRLIGLDGTVDRLWSLWAATPNARPTAADALALTTGAQGTILLVSPTRGVALLGRAAEAEWLPAPCRSPRWLAPAPAGRAVLACEDGTLALLGKETDIAR